MEVLNEDYVDPDDTGDNNVANHEEVEIMNPELNAERIPRRRIALQSMN